MSEMANMENGREDRATVGRVVKAEFLVTLLTGFL